MKTVISYTTKPPTRHTYQTFNFIFDDGSSIENVMISHKPFNEKMILFYFNNNGTKYAYHKYNNLAYEVR